MSLRLRRSRPPCAAIWSKQSSSEDFARQTEIIRGFATSSDPFVEQTLTAWRGGSLYIFETNDTKTPFLLEAHSDGEGQRQRLQSSSMRHPLTDAAGNPMLFSGSELTRRRYQFQTAQGHQNYTGFIRPGESQSENAAGRHYQARPGPEPDYLSFFEARLKVEKDKEVIKALHEAIAVTGIASEDRNDSRWLQSRNWG